MEVGERAAGVGRGRMGPRSRSGEVGSRRVRVLNARLTLWRSVRGAVGLDGAVVLTEGGMEPYTLSMRAYCWCLSVAIVDGRSIKSRRGRLGNA